MDDTRSFYHEITKRYGTIQRARGCFLYTRKGVRLTDLYQEGGRAILGWGSSRFTVFKNVLGRGLTGSFETDYIGQVQKAASTLLSSERAIGLFCSKTAALKAALSLYSGDTSVWKPWGEDRVDWSSVGAVIIAPPLPWTQTLWIAACKPSSSALDLQKHSQAFPAPLLAAISRSMYDMIAALKEREEKDWFIYDRVITKYWTRKGPYLYPKVEKEHYIDFVEHCLDCNLVISPAYDIPSIVPYKADFGVFGKLKSEPFV